MFVFIFIILFSSSVPEVIKPAERDIFDDLLTVADAAVDGVADAIHYVKQLTDFTRNVTEIIKKEEPTNKVNTVDFLGDFYEVDWLDLFKEAYANISTDQKFIRNDWEAIQKGIKIRYFSSESYSSSNDYSEMWNEMGEDVECMLYTNKLVCSLPSKIVKIIKPLKVFTHGFGTTVDGQKIVFLKAWMEVHEGKYDVILLDWESLASFTGVFSYDWAARNSIDIGQYLGYCLAALSNGYGIKGADIHLVGHSLGAHLMGKAGRVFHEVQKNKEKIGRITGLDPAGLRFTAGAAFEAKRIEALPELLNETLSRHSASFVDIIHTDGGHIPCIVFCPIGTLPKFGTLQPMGHFDFYPNGGSNQPGCLLGIDTQEDGVPVACSHSRVLRYYLHSILKPELFPADECSSVANCSNDVVEGKATDVFMGEAAMETFKGERKMFHIKVKDCHWDYEEHNNYKIINICVGREADFTGEPRG